MGDDGRRGNSSNERGISVSIYAVLVNLFCFLTFITIMTVLRSNHRTRRFLSRFGEMGESKGGQKKDYESEKVGEA